tara:strand:+ start:5033 stop:5569 length:537 start_codon:yes stop_codon:yes gene_type:complete
MKCGPAACLKVKVRQDFHAANPSIHHTLYLRNMTGICNVSIHKNMTGATIYILFKQDEIVYVGQSINPYNRIGQHTKDKDFDHFRLMSCLKTRMTYWEDYLIWKYDPKYNIQKKNKGRPKPKKKPKIEYEYECEPLFIDSNTNNIGFGYSSTTGSRLVIDSGRTFQSNVLMINDPIRA